jgi:hypothetical protein
VVLVHQRARESLRRWVVLGHSTGEYPIIAMWSIEVVCVLKEAIGTKRKGI